ncbi:helix-turn-helix transcriptional regulator [Acholeplasma laidlawii]|jgi:DNA-binding HxlR family transcriptional regulator|uniref:winged helix-turn-helix transcriptional regulator n=1 Tax=Acholeplasma laidlawii TaxID=2148 RepID=UPI00084C55EA|nr:helix-turn-helix domain-containing protein [Acholeplasma laidlawii]MBG0762324.1 helix-turn-helix transcriptional regulator [Acholeplasma laidlawii]OED58920.1 transcriptional regulator [Acholeplasma laidlawii]
MQSCSVERAVNLFGDKWKFLIIRDLMDGKMRFSELKNSIGNISQKVLTQNLRALESNGLLTRTVYPVVPPKVEYELTELGYSLKLVIDALRKWGEIYAKA